MAMSYFVTGATGFIGRFLLAQLLKRPEAELYVLVRESSQKRFAEQLTRYGDAAQRIHVVVGDITSPGLIDPADFERLRGRIDHVFHLAAVYDMGMSDEVAERVNREGTRHVVDFVNRLGGSVMLHHVSSIAVAGPYFKGVFHETDFAQGQALDHPYYRSKFEAERVVREHSRVPTRIYRPGVVVGHSKTGEIDKIDGPYYFFGLVRLISRLLPRKLPVLMVEGGRMPIVPVDFVVEAMDAIAHKQDAKGGVFCLVPSEAPSVGELVQSVFRAAGGPSILRFGFAPAARLAHELVRLTSRLLPLWLTAFLTKLFGVPVSVFEQMFSQTVYDSSHTRLALADTGIACPTLSSYADAMWRGWLTDHATRTKALPHPKPPRLAAC